MLHRILNASVPDHFPHPHTKDKSRSGLCETTHLKCPKVLVIRLSVSVHSNLFVVVEQTDRIEITVVWLVLVIYNG